jgi:hypothetical protein
MGLVALSAVLVASTSFAAEFEFELEGDGELEWAFEQTESSDMTLSSGAEFNFNGGAGTDGYAKVVGDYSGVAGVFAEGAAGYGLAYGDTDGNNHAEAGYAAGALSINGGYAADADKISYEGLATAGGAGGVETSLTYGWDTIYTNAGTGMYNVDADLAGSFN